MWTEETAVILMNEAVNRAANACVCVCTCGDRTGTAGNGGPRNVNQGWSGALFGLSLLFLLLAEISSSV